VRSAKLFLSPIRVSDDPYEKKSSENRVRVQED
jgi:hypothetical protein